MFNIGDVVEVFMDIPDIYPITRIGSWGVVSRIDGGGDVWVGFEEVTGSCTEEGNHHYPISPQHLSLRDKNLLKKTAVERKIRSMYARQYRKTGQSCFV